MNSQGPLTNLLTAAALGFQTRGHEQLLKPFSGGLTSRIEVFRAVLYKLLRRSYALKRKQISWIRY
jgi:hypothetical protein